jgi:long-chain acyl-CoA synthetase
MNVADHVQRGAEEFPDRVAIVFDDRRITYRELNRRANQVAHLLASWGTAPGDRVGLFLPNIPEFVVVYLGVQKIGAVAVSVNAALKRDEVRHVLADSGAGALFTTAALAVEVAFVRGALPGLRQVVLCEGEGNGLPTLAQALVPLDEHFVARRLEPGAPSALLYTSGTTGKPKGAVLTHGNVVFNHRAAARCVGAQPGDCHLLFLPLFHCFGQNFIMNTALGSGGTLLLQRRFAVETVVDAVSDGGVTHFYGVPTVFIRLLDAGVPGPRFSTVKYFFSAAATMPREVAQRWYRHFGAILHEGYGLTETSPFASYNHARYYKPGSVGTPIDGVEMKIIGEGGEERAVGEWGEICIKGPNVMAGYFGLTVETQAVLQEGWFRSGDIGYRDHEGYYFLVDRVKDMVNCAGWKVWPREVEDVLYRHPAVAECAVVGIPDRVSGEALQAFLVLRDEGPFDGEELRRYCEERLARYKVPRDFVLCRELPRNAAGKILKRVLRASAPAG